MPHLEKGDIVIDGGNSEYLDSNRRCQALAEKGILFIGTGVSGGEEGARFGPSLMPGGHADAWYGARWVWDGCGSMTSPAAVRGRSPLLYCCGRPHVKDIFQACAAKADDEPCCDWVSRP